jgi:SAM-dependent methyltransferase
MCLDSSDEARTAKGLAALIREQAKKVLKAIGLYEPVRRIWLRRPNLRVTCWNAGYRLAGAGDKLPIPPTRLIRLAAASREVSWFLHSGNLGQESIRFALRRNGLEIEGFKEILDFGCGCGRIMRHWRNLVGPCLFGTDYNPDLVHWCQTHLDGHADFQTNDLTPPLDYPDEKFDLIYAISVFTHLTEDLQHRWMNELGRVLKPGGVLLITLHGESRLHELDRGERELFRSGHMVVRHEDAVGTNACGSYHPESYVRNALAGALEVIDFIAAGARDANQDIFLLRKPASTTGQPSPLPEGVDLRAVQG